MKVIGTCRTATLALFFPGVVTPSVSFVFPAPHTSVVAKRSSFIQLRRIGRESFGRGFQHDNYRRQRLRARKGDNVNMIFDFIKKRTQEGLEQTQNLVSAAQEGRLSEALKETSAYVKERNDKFVDGLAQSRMRFLNDLEGLFGMTGPLDETLEKLEEALLQADLGATTSFQIIEDLREIATSEGRRLEPDDIKAVLRATLIQVLNGGMPEAPAASDDRDASKSSPDRDSMTLLANRAAIKFADPAVGGPTVLFFMGANGMGKTTTVGKVASRLRTAGGQKVLIAAADTFRAAAVEQLEEWALRSDADIVKPIETDEKQPASVVSRAADIAIEGGYDVLIVDTSGRLSNNYSLNQELNDMKRVLKEKIPGAPHETLLVMDASLGRNAVDQARVWKEDVGISALVVTKLDGTARAGFVVSIVSDLGIPVKLIGVGESLSDLRDFEPVLFVDALLGYSEEEARRLQQTSEKNPVLQKRMLERMRRAQQEAKPFVRPQLDSYVGSGNPRRKRKAKAKAKAKIKGGGEKKRR